MCVIDLMGHKQFITAATTTSYVTGKFGGLIIDPLGPLPTAIIAWFYIVLFG